MDKKEELWDSTYNRSWSHSCQHHHKCVLLTIHFFYFILTDLWHNPGPCQGQVVFHQSVCGCHAARVRAVWPAKETILWKGSEYRVLCKEKLRTEVSPICESPDIRGCCGALALRQVLQSYNLQETFSETVVPCSILITTPMTTAEAERRFYTL